MAPRPQHSALRCHIFGTAKALEQLRSLRPKTQGQIKAINCGLRTERHIFALIGVLGVLSMIGIDNDEDSNLGAAVRTQPAAETRKKSAVKPLLEEEQWKKIEILKEAPAALENIRQSAIAFQYHENIPAIQLDGKDFGNTLPEALWVKVEQPGNTIALINTNRGTLVKILEEVSPGFASRCKMDVNSLGTLDGKAADVTRDELEVSSIWIVQDAPADLKHVPGYVAVTAAK